MPDGLARVSAEHVGEHTELARQFESAWRSPTTERLVSLLHPDVVLRQPGRTPIRGKTEARREFEKLFRWLPGLRGVIKRSVSTPSYTTIEYHLVVPVGRKGLALGAVDTIVVEDGLIIDREVYYDRLALVAHLLRYPWHLVHFYRYLRA